MAVTEDDGTEDIELVDLNKIDEDFDFYGNERHKKSRNPYKAGGPRRSQRG